MDVAKLSKDEMVELIDQIMQGLYRVFKRDEFSITLMVRPASGEPYFTAGDDTDFAGMRKAVDEREEGMSEIECRENNIH